MVDTSLHISLGVVGRQECVVVRFTFLLRFSKSGETCCGKGVRVVLLDPSCHFFAHITTEIEALARAWGTHEATEFHGAFGEIRDLEAAYFAIPLRRRMNDGFELLAQCIDGNGVVDVEESGAEDVGGRARPVRKGILDEVTERDNEAAKVPDFDDNVGGCDLFDTAPFSFNNDDVIDPDRLGDCDLKTGEKI